MSKTPNTQTYDQDSTVGENFDGGLRFLEDVFRAGDEEIKEQLDLDKDQVSELLEVISNIQVAELEHAQSITDLQNLRELMARSADSAMSCAYDIIDNALSSQLTRAYLSEVESGETASVDIRLELDENRDIVWLRVQDPGRGIGDGELKSAAFGGGKSGGDGLLNHFGVGLLVALCYFERSIELHADSSPTWSITSMTTDEDQPRKIAGPVMDLHDTPIETVSMSEWNDWEGELEPAESGTRVEIPIPFTHFASDLEGSKVASLEDVADDEPENRYLYGYAQRFRRQLGRDYQALLQREPFVQDDQPVKMYFGWNDECYKSEKGTSGSLKSSTDCRVVPLEMCYEEPADHIDYDWPEIQVNKEVSWEREGEIQEALVRLKLGYLDEKATCKQYDIKRDDVDERQFGGTKILTSQDTLGDVYRPSKDQQGGILSILGRSVASNNVDLLGIGRMDEHNRVFGRLDVVPKPGSKVPSIMKAHKQGVEMGGSPAWDAMKGLFEDLPISDLKSGTWSSEAEKQKSTSTTDETTLHDQRKQQTHERFEHDAERGVIKDFEKEIPTSGFKTDNLAKWTNGRTELVEQKSDDEKVSPRSVWLKIGEIAELGHSGRDIDTVTFRCGDITRDNESAVQRAVVALAHLHGVKVKILQANDDAEWDTKDDEILSYNPSEADLNESNECHLGKLSDVLNAIRDEANNINVN